MKIYEELKEALEEGKMALLRSEYTSGAVTKTLHVEGGEGFEEAVAEARERGAFEESESGLRLSEFYSPSPRLIIFGGGHIALPLCEIGVRLGFSVTVYDDRPAYASAARFPKATRVYCEDFANATKFITLRPTDYVVIVTRGHQHDKECLRLALSGEEPAYLGMIGSRRRVAIVRNQVKEEGYDEERIARLHSPIGLSIGAQGPEEIAISILAEIIQQKRQAPEGANEYTALSSAFPPDLDLASYMARTNEKAALITVVSTRGSTPRKAGARMASHYDGRTQGTVGGGCAESDVISDSRKILLDGGYLLRVTDLTDDEEDEEGMVCGGTMKMIVEAIEV